MNAKELKKIYPFAKLSHKSDKNPQKLNYFDGQEFLIFDYEQLSDSEISLLTALSEPINDSQWFGILFNDDKIPDISVALKVIQFKTTIKHEHQEIWLNNFSAFFNNVFGAFWVNDNYGALVIEEQTIDGDNFVGFLSILDEDFSSTTSIFIGIAVDSKLIKDIFYEEYNLFIHDNIHKKIITFKEAYLPFYLAPHIRNSTIANVYLSKINTEPDSIELIHYLWQNDLNIGSTADDLHLHRNTINYRLDKFFDSTGIDLRNIKELFLCYLLLNI